MEKEGSFRLFAEPSALIRVNAKYTDYTHCLRSKVKAFLSTESIASLSSQRIDDWWLCDDSN